MKKVFNLIGSKMEFREDFFTHHCAQGLYPQTIKSYVWIHNLQ